MRAYRLSSQERQNLADALNDARYEIIVATDDIDDAFKIKVDGGCWSPPMGEATL